MRQAQPAGFIRMPEGRARHHLTGDSSACAEDVLLSSNRSQGRFFRHGSIQSGFCQCQELHAQPQRQ